MVFSVNCNVFTTFKSTIYKSFIRPHLDYRYVVYDQPSNATFSSKIGSVQYDATLATKGVIRGSSHENLYQESGLECLRHRHWMRCLCLFYKGLSDKVLKYIYELISL